VRIGRHAAARSPEHTQDGRLVIGLGRLRQQIEVALNEARDRRASSGRVALSAPNHSFVHAERQLWHIRIIARQSYVSRRLVPMTPEIAPIPEVPETLREAARAGASSCGPARWRTPAVPALRSREERLDVRQGAKAGEEMTVHLTIWLSSAVVSGGLIVLGGYLIARGTIAVNLYVTGLVMVIAVVNIVSFIGLILATIKVMRRTPR
jgi:hypothetical protein